MTISFEKGKKRKNDKDKLEELVQKNIQNLKEIDEAAADRALEKILTGKSSGKIESISSDYDKEMLEKRMMFHRNISDMDAQAERLGINLLEE